MTENLERQVRVAARALGRHGLAHAYGHCSVRLDDATFLVSPAKPLGLVAVGEACVRVSLEGPLPDAVLGEVRIHREIYRRRHDVAAVVRAQPPHAMALSTLSETPQARHGFGAYFYPRPPLWDDPRLLRSDDAAGALADTLGESHAIFMRGNGVVTVGASLPEAVTLMWYAEDAARVELACRSAGAGPGEGLLSKEEASDRASFSGRILERMWDYLTHADPEAGG